MSLTHRIGGVRETVEIGVSRTTRRHRLREHKIADVERRLPVSSMC